MRLALHWKIIIGLILGIIWSLISSYAGWNEFTGDWISPFGTIFIRALKLIAVPLILFSIISGIAGLKDINSLGRMGVKTLGLYLLTTIFSITIGLTLVNVIKPGSFMSEEVRVNNRIGYELWAQENGKQLIDSKNYLINKDYNSVVDAYKENHSKKELTESEAKIQKAIIKKSEVAKQVNQSGPLQFLVDMVPENIIVSLGNNKFMLQVIFFAIFFGICMIMVGGEVIKPVVGFIEGANAIFLKMVDVIMKYSPFFVFALMAGVMTKMGGTPQGILDLILSLGWYSLVVFSGLMLLIFIVYPLLLRIATKKIGYRKFFRSIGPAQLLAFSSSSSAATLPVTMECVEDNIGVSKEVTSFVLPIGATVNMDGTSLYQAVAVIFLAQIHLIDLSFADQATIILTATLASIGSAAVPGAGLVMLMIVLGSLGLNPLWIAIIFPVDRILDMCRTVVNVTGDATVSTVIAKLENQLNNKP